jgi:orotate phosphoribosyltransferase
MSEFKFYRTAEAWIETFRLHGAYFRHDGNAKRPHILMSGGEHSTGYFNSFMVMAYPKLLEQACADLITLLEDETKFLINRFVGPAKGAITLVHEMARQKGCLTAYAEKNPLDDNFSYRRFMIKPGEVHLPCDDVISTGKSLRATAEASLVKDCTVCDYAVCIVNRSGKKQLYGKKIISLITADMPVWKAQECPWCKVNSKPLRPREKNNWELLNAKY